MYCSWREPVFRLGWQFEQEESAFAGIVLDDLRTALSILYPGVRHCCFPGCPIGLRHMVVSALNGWTQVNLGCCSSIEEAKENLRYHL